MDEYHLHLLKELSKDNTLSQRELSKRLGLSLGKLNFIVNALLKKGLLKAKRFKNSKKKLAYMYILTPRGLSVKTELTYDFMKRKMLEYDALKMEIEELRKEIDMIEAGK